MTTRTDGAELRFTPRADPGADPATPANPALASEPGIATMLDGRKLRVTLEIQVNGAWKKVDPNHFDNDNLQAIAGQCNAIYQTTMQKADQPKTLTVYFEQKNLTESWKSAILGKVSNRFKEEVVDLTFKKLEYKSAGSNELQVFDVQTHEISAADADRVNQLASTMTWISKAIFGNRERFIEQPKKIKPKSAAEANSEKLAAIKRTLNVQEAGSRENRCMTLSIAAILLKAYLDDLQAAAAELNIPLAPQAGETPLVTLSNGLIELAARTIETNGRFTRPDTADNPNGHFINIIAALRAAGQDIADEADRNAVVQQYAALIRRPGQMLDVPVLDALEMNRIPIITLVPSNNGDLVLGSISNTITFDKGSLDTYALTEICFVVRDRLHYQPVIPMSTGDDIPNAAQQEKLRSILKNDMDKMLHQIQILIADTRASAVKSPEFNQLVGSVVNKYPFDAKPKIVQMLRDARRSIGDDLISQRNDLFITGATHAFLTNPGPNSATPASSSRPRVAPVVSLLDDTDDESEILLPSATPASSSRPRGTPVISLLDDTDDELETLPPSTAVNQRHVVGSLGAQWDFPSDHLPVGVEVNGLRMISWNVLNTAFIPGIITKNTQGLNGSMITRLNKPSSTPGLTEREKVVINSIESMQFSADVIALQECSDAFLTHLKNNVSPSEWDIIRSFDTPETYQPVILYKKSKLKLDESETIKNIYTETKDNPVQKAVFTDSRGHKCQVINTHIPGNPKGSARQEFANYMNSVTSKSSMATVALGDNNFERQEMLKAYQTAGLVLFKLYSPWNTNVSTEEAVRKYSKCIDHILVLNDTTSRTLNPSEITTQADKLKQMINLLNPGQVY